MLLSVVLAAATACSSVSTVRLQPETVDVGPGLRPIAAIQTNVVAWYVLFVQVGPDVSLDKVVNQMLIVRAKTMGADKVANLRFDITPDDGIWALRKLFFYRSAHASGIAVQVTAMPSDPSADDGPEPAAPAGPGGSQ